MEGSRSLKRRHLVYYLEVFDNEGGELLGRLVDITTRGIKLVSKTQIPINKMFSIRMILPAGYFRSKEFCFDMKSIWSSNDVNPDFYDTGFEVVNLKRDERKMIRKMIDLVGFND